AICTLSLHDALPIWEAGRPILGWFSETDRRTGGPAWKHKDMVESALRSGKPVPDNVLADYPDLLAKHRGADTPKPTAKNEGVKPDRKSTRLNSSHVK